MDIGLFLQTLVSGLEMGGVYALVAGGLALILGVIRIVNFSHGEFFMISMYGAFLFHFLFKIDPLIYMPIGALLLFLVGKGTYRLFISKIAEASFMTQVLATFGLMIFLRYLFHFFFTTDPRFITNALLAHHTRLGEAITIDFARLVTFVGSMLTIGAVFLFLNRTKTGKAIKATAQDYEAALSLGIDTERMYSLAWSIGLLCSGIAGAFVAQFYPIFPEVGQSFIIYALVAVVLGGFGSIGGALVASLILGLGEAFTGVYISANYKEVFVYLIFIGILFFKPRGLQGA
jgi:branched-chain amino acid transport system permease protein